MEPHSLPTELAGVSPGRQFAARIIVLLTVAGYLLLMMPLYGRPDGMALLIVMSGFTLVLLLLEGNAGPLGFHLHPRRGWLYWLRFSLLSMLLVGTVLIVFYPLRLQFGGPLYVPRADPQFAVSYLIHYCVWAPVQEELLYRSLLVFALRPTFNERWTLLICSATFAIAHILSGVASPENQIGGFFLTWAYLRSGSLLIPLALHSGGNLLAFSAMICNWYWLPELISNSRHP